MNFKKIIFLAIFFKGNRASHKNEKYSPLNGIAKIKCAHLTLRCNLIK